MGDLKIIEQKTDVESTLKDALENLGPHLEGVMVIGVGKDGEQYLRTSTISGYQKSFMVAFANAWLSKWFELDDFN